VGFTLGCSDDAATTSSGRVEGDETGGAAATGGAPVIITTGSTSSGGSASGDDSSTGGATSGGANTTGNGGCAPAQLDCSGAPQTCDEEEEAWPLPTEGCTCDTTRPVTRNDCPDDSLFTCRRGFIEVNGDTSQVRFECSCVPTTSSCSQSCPTAFPDPALSGYDCDGVGDASCGCGY
jgi:hypothetical protein